ncbi:MAG: hypothetical protein MUC95_09740 [Spirochaetes bacterium]|nr:hypothetical protein [Spirochaetota bacterium]
MKNTRIRFKSLLFLLLFSISAVSNGTAGDIIIQEEYLDILPDGRATGSMLENWITPVVFHQVETGGLSRVDLPRYSAYGISWIEQTYHINKIDITDPFRSGYPLFEPAWESISGIEIKSYRENDPSRTGLDWNIGMPAGNNPFEASYYAIFPTGGGSLIPEGKLDREPSFPFGASKKRRRYKLSNEISGSYYSADNFFCE